MRKQEHELKDKKKKTTLIVILATFLVVCYATFAQPLAYNTAIKMFKKVTDIFDFDNNNSDDNNSENNNSSSNKNDGNNNNKGNKPSNIVGNTNDNDNDIDIDDVKPTTPEKWNIRFTKAIKTEIHGYAREISPVKFDALSIFFDVVLTGPNDSISYEFTISNKGIMKTKIDEIIVVPETNENSVIAYEMSGIEVGDRLLPGESTEMEVKIYYNDKVDSDIKYYNDNLKIVVNFAQD